MSARAHSSTRPRVTNLASFDNAYAVAVQKRAASGARQFIVATGNPLQPYRVSRVHPTGSESLKAMVA